MFDFQDCVKRFFKYLVEGLGVALASHLISGQRYSLMEMGMIGASAAITLMLLDTFAPGVAAGSRMGSGYKLGMQLTAPNLLPAIEPFGCMASEAAVEAEIDAVMHPSSVEAKPVKYHYRKNCTCQMPCVDYCQTHDCKGCEDNCKLDCPTHPCRIPGHGNIASTDCSYKLIDGYYSKALLPGYNECVQPYNS